jgi:hypothetical protein
VQPVLIAIGGALFGALASGGIQLYLNIREKVDRKRVAARLVLGDIYVAELVFLS